MKRILLSWYFLCLIGTLMLLEWLRAANANVAAFGGLRAVLVSSVLSSSDQIWEIFCLATCFLGLLYVEINERAVRAGQGFLRSLLLEDLCKLLLLAFAVGVYVRDYHRADQPGSTDLLLLGIDQSTNVLVLLAGMLVGQTAGIFGAGEGGAGSFRRMALFFFVLFLGAVSLIQGDAPQVYQYHERTRWTGLWVNPNTYGLLMGTGIVLALGQAFDLLNPGGRSHSNLESENPGAQIWRRFGHLFFAAAACLMAFGLIKSYSRGAWLATICGTIFLMWQLGGGNFWILGSMGRNAVTLG